MKEYLPDSLVHTAKGLKTTTYMLGRLLLHSLQHLLRLACTLIEHSNLTPHLKTNKRIQHWDLLKHWYLLFIIDTWPSSLSNLLVMLVSAVLWLARTEKVTSSTLRASVEFRSPVWRRIESPNSSKICCTANSSRRLVSRTPSAVSKRTCSTLCKPLISLARLA